jgi:succinate-semialdehyde dehydrogenase/glutarate-semialdehyde dehydrogenase
VTIQTTDPATGEVLETFEPLDAAALEDRLARAAGASARCRRTSFAERRAWLLAAADLLDREAEDVARTMTTEMGKPIAGARAEVAKSAAGLRFYAEHGEAFLADAPLADPGRVGATAALTRYEPLGVVLAVMPWNFPLWQVVRFAAPALMAGNVGLLKHAPNVPRIALYIEDLLARAGVPAGGFQSLLVDVPAVETVLRDPRIAAATLTGGEAAGRAVARIAADEVKKTVLELGGSDPFVVMPSADLDAAARVGVTARVQNNGQSCIAAKRFVVHDDVHDAFAERFVARMAALRVGDPHDEATDVGPLATRAGRDATVELVADALARGARVLCGGAAPERPGWFYAPTVLADVTPDMRVASEELFAPVATLHRVPDVDAAIELANATPYGLGSNAWTTDPAERDRFVAELQAGAVFVNGMTASFPELPFGGIKRSGYGRELSAEGMRELCNLKTVWIGR